MRAITFQAPGTPDVLKAVELPNPEPGPGQVRVKVAAAGICYHDLLSRSGKIPGTKPGQVLGHEIAGTVDKVGVGDKVPGGAAGRVGARVTVYPRLFCGTCRQCLSGRHDLCRGSSTLGDYGGGYAEYVVAPASNVIEIADAIPFEAAALAVCPIGTSVRALIGIADVRPGDSVLITGASGGLGLHQIQIAKALGASVIAVTSGTAKESAIRAAGADYVVVAPDLKFSREVWSITGKRGVDAVMENVVSNTFEESVRAMAAGAVCVVMGNVAVQSVAVNPGLMIMRRLRLQGAGNATFADVHMGLAMMASGAIRPAIDRVLPFPRAAEGHALLEGRGAIGRVVLSGW